MRPNLNFAGYAADVLEHYRAALGGEATITRYAGTMPPEHIPDGFGDKIMYARLMTPYGDIEVMDAPPGRESPVGGNVAIAIDVDDETRAGAVFAHLASDGEIVMPFEETFFARKFGMATDKFGIRWLVTFAGVTADVS
jgi:PhnB protein